MNDFDVLTKTWERNRSFFNFNYILYQLLAKHGYKTEYNIHYIKQEPECEKLFKRCDFPFVKISLYREVKIIEKWWLRFRPRESINI